MKPKLYVYQKIIVVFTALIIPVYLINLWLNMMGLTYIKKEYSNSIISNVDFYSRQLNDQISFIRNQQLQLLNDSDLQKLSFLAETIDGYEEVQLVNRIKERLATIQNSSDYLVNTGVYIKSYAKTISTLGGLSDLPNNEMKVIESLNYGEPKQSVYIVDGRLFFIESANNLSIIAYLELSREKLEETLNQLVQYYDDSGVLLTDDNFARHISLHYDSRILNKIADNMRQENRNSSDSYITEIGNKSYRVTYHQISSLGWTLYTYINQNEITGPLKKFNVWFIILSFVSVMIILVFSFSVNYMIHKPLNKLIKAFKILETDHFHIPIRPRGDNEFDYLYRSFDTTVEKLNLAIRQNYEQKIALQHSELKQLQSQINPHFLYNGFYNIYRLCKSGDFESVSTLSQKLGSYYQFITKSGADEVPLFMEYRHATDYCDIQRIRFSNRINVEVSDLPELSKQIMVPRLIIQPIIENAFEHAFENSLKGGNVYIAVEFENSRLSICVEDDANTLTDDHLHCLQENLANASKVIEKTGLINVSSRIHLKYGEDSGLFLSRSKHRGLKAEIVIIYQ